MKDGEKITINGKVKTVYLCDQKDTCCNSEYCGKECKFTLNRKHKINNKKEQKQCIG